MILRGQVGMQGPGWLSAPLTTFYRTTVRSIILNCWNTFTMENPRKRLFHSWRSRWKKESQKGYFLWWVTTLELISKAPTQSAGIHSSPKLEFTLNKQTMSRTQLHFSWRISTKQCRPSWRHRKNCADHLGNQWVQFWWHVYIFQFIN